MVSKQHHRCAVNHQAFVCRAVYKPIIVIHFFISFACPVRLSYISQLASQPEPNPKLEQIVTTNVLLMNLYLWTLIFIKNNKNTCAELSVIVIVNERVWWFLILVLSLGLFDIE